MATVAQFETAIDAVITAIDAGNYETAYVEIAKAAVYAAALPRTTVDGASIEYTAKVESLQKAIEAAELAANRTTRRLVSTRTAHSRRTGRGGCRSGIDCDC